MIWDPDRLQSELAMLLLRLPCRIQEVTRSFDPLGGEKMEVRLVLYGKDLRQWFTLEEVTDGSSTHFQNPV